MHLCLCFYLDVYKDNYKIYTDILLLKYITVFELNFCKHAWFQLLKPNLKPLIFGMDWMRLQIEGNNKRLEEIKASWIMQTLNYSSFKLMFRRIDDKTFTDFEV